MQYWCVLPLALAAAALIYSVYSAERAALISTVLNRTRAVATALDLELAAPGGTVSAQDIRRRVAAMLAAQKLPPDWRAAVIDNHAIVVARAHDAHLYVGRPVRPDLHGHMLRAPDGAYESLTLDRIPAVTVYSLAPDSRWTVSLGIPLAELTASLYQGIAWLAVYTGFVA